MRKIIVSSLLASLFVLAPSAYACEKHSCGGKDGKKCECEGGTCGCGDKHDHGKDHKHDHGKDHKHDHKEDKK